MFTVHATKKLLDRLKVRPDPAPPEATTQLGNWYATALFWKPQVVLFVNEPTLLPVLVPLAPISSVLERLPAAVAEMLNEFDIPKAMIDNELAAMTEHVVTKTATDQSLACSTNSASSANDSSTRTRTSTHYRSDSPTPHADPSTNQRATPIAKCAYDSSVKHPNGSNAKTKPPTLDAKPATSETPTRRRDRAINKPINRVLTRKGRTPPASWVHTDVVFRQRRQLG